MVEGPLLEREREVERSRAKLTQDLAVLCSPDTFASFTDDLKQEARHERCILGGTEGASRRQSGCRYCDRSRGCLARCPATADSHCFDRGWSLQPLAN